MICLHVDTSKTPSLPSRTVAIGLTTGSDLEQPLSSFSYTPNDLASTLAKNHRDCASSYWWGIFANSIRARKTSSGHITLVQGGVQMQKSHDR